MDVLLGSAARLYCSLLVLSAERRIRVSARRNAFCCLLVSVCTRFIEARNRKTICKAEGTPSFCAQLVCTGEDWRAAGDIHGKSSHRCQWMLLRNKLHWGDAISLSTWSHFRSNARRERVQATSQRPLTRCAFEISCSETGAVRIRRLVGHVFVHCICFAHATCSADVRLWFVTRGPGLRIRLLREDRCIFERLLGCTRRMLGPVRLTREDEEASSRTRDDWPTNGFASPFARDAAV